MQYIYKNNNKIIMSIIYFYIIRFKYHLIYCIFNILHNFISYNKNYNYNSNNNNILLCIYLLLYIKNIKQIIILIYFYIISNFKCITKS